MRPVRTLEDALRPEKRGHFAQDSEYWCPEHGEISGKKAQIDSDEYQNIRRKGDIGRVAGDSRQHA